MDGSRRSNFVNVRIKLYLINECLIGRRLGFSLGPLVPLGTSCLLLVLLLKMTWFYLCVGLRPLGIELALKCKQVQHLFRSNHATSLYARFACSGCASHASRAIVAFGSFNMQPNVYLKVVRVYLWFIKAVLMMFLPF